MTQSFIVTPDTYLLLLLAILAVVGVSMMIRLLRVNTRILREHRISRASKLLEGDVDAEDRLDRLEEPPV